MTEMILSRFKALTNGININRGIELLPILGKEILQTKVDELREKSKKFKPLILSYLRLNKKARTTDLMKEFNLTFGEIHFILKELQNEGSIIITETEE